MKTDIYAVCCAIGVVLSGRVIQPAEAQTYELTRLVEGSSFHGLNGLAIDGSGRLLAGSVVGGSIYLVDRDRGVANVLIPPPLGIADDIAIAPDGTMAWTSLLTGEIYTRNGDGPIRKLASGLSGVNSLAFRKDGRLYASEVFGGDALYEIDPEGTKPARKLFTGLGGLNGFEFGPDDKLYGPLWFKGQAVKLDVDKLELSVVADGFGVPAAVNFGPGGKLYVADTSQGCLYEIDPATGAKRVLAQLKPALDNLAIGPDGKIFVSNMADNGGLPPEKWSSLK